MRLLSLVAILLIPFSLNAQSDKLTGKWITTSDNDEWQELVYEFHEDGTMVMIVDKEKYPTVDGITYSINKRKGKLEFEMTYTSPWNKKVEHMQGLIDFIKRDQIQVEIFALNSPPDPLAFTEDALIFDRL